MDSTSMKSYILSAGADLCGIAAADAFGGAPEGYHPRDTLPSCQSVIVFAKRFLGAAVRCNSQVPYTIVRNMLSDAMDKMAVNICTYLEGEGWDAVPTGTIAHTHRDEKTGRFRNIVSAKHSAELAGLGRIGKNTLLITPEFGNMVWLSVILTDMPLDADRKIGENLCPEGCRLCIDSCPVKALGAPEMKQQECWDHAFGEVKGDWQLRCCRCRTICPHCFGTKNKPQY